MKKEYLIGIAAILFFAVIFSLSKVSLSSNAADKTFFCSNATSSYMTLPALTSTRILGTTTTSAIGERRMYVEIFASSTPSAEPIYLGIRNGLPADRGQGPVLLATSTKLIANETLYKGEINAISRQATGVIVTECLY